MRSKRSTRSMESTWAVVEGKKADPAALRARRQIAARALALALTRAVSPAEGLREPSRHIGTEVQMQMRGAVRMQPAPVAAMLIAAGRKLRMVVPAAQMLPLHESLARPTRWSGNSML